MDDLGGGGGDDGGGGMVVCIILTICLLTLSWLAGDYD